MRSQNRADIRESQCQSHGRCTVSDQMNNENIFLYPHEENETHLVGKSSKVAISMVT